MAEGEPNKYKFMEVKLFKSKTLGTGSYGAVCKAKCDQLICAAKLLHPVLFSQASSSVKLQPEERFEQECHFLGLINHPNIVQYLGTYRDPETNAPVLLMELMDESLTHFLNSAPADIPYHIQVNLSYDITQALAFLHANGIIHRDLSSNNILLIAGSRAKVSDFGMSKSIDLNKTHIAKLTSCPGARVFMPPEALNEPPVYTEKLDNFSLGVIIVQIITRDFPSPTERFEMIDVPDPRSSSGVTILVQVPIAEVKRREAQINLIDTTHPLLQSALNCLKDQEADRPTSQQLCQYLGTLKETSLYKECSKAHANQPANTGTQEVALLKYQIHERDELLQTKNKELQAMTEALKAKEEFIRKKETEILHLQARLGDLLYAENKALKEKSKSQDFKNSKDKQDLVHNCSYGFAENPTTSLEGQHHTRTPRKQHHSTEKRKSTVIQLPPLPDPYIQQLPSRKKLILSSKPLPHSPYSLSAGSSAVIGNRAYFKSRQRAVVYKFEFRSNRWFELPQNPITGFTIVCTARFLTSVGGRHAGEASNKLYSFIDEEWKEYYPAMPTKRISPVAVYTKPYLIVAGGASDTHLSAVEVLDTTSFQWSAVRSLPFPVAQASAAVYKGFLYIAAGKKTTNKEERAVLRSSLSSLIFSKPRISAWERIARLSFSQSTLTAVGDYLLAIGGRASPTLATKDVYVLNQTTNLWDFIGQLPTCRCDALTAVLPENKLLVVGSSMAEESMSTEVVTVSVKQ